MKLTPKQERAKSGGDYVRIVAGPGSGKTTLLVARTLHLLEDPGARVALVTFGKPAADEMRERLSETADMTRVGTATFDAYARHQVRDKIGRRRPPKPLERWQVIERAMRASEVSFDIEVAQRVVDRLGALDDYSEQDPDFVCFFDRYRQELEEDGLIEFSEIARMAVEGMRSGEIEPLSVTDLLVDEFQDTAPMQYAWVQQHWLKGVRVTTVGDDDQSIYSFRYALGYEGMEMFAREVRAQEYHLDDCFRCAPQIVEAAQRVIERNQARIPKTITSKASVSGSARYRQFRGSESEVDAIVEQMERTWERGGSTAVLARTNRLLDDVEQYLSGRRVRIRRIGGRSIWDQPAGEVFLGLADLVANRTLEQIPKAASALTWAGLEGQWVGQYRGHLRNIGLFAPLPQHLREVSALEHFHAQMARWASFESQGMPEIALDCILGWMLKQSQSKRDSALARVAARALEPREGVSQSLSQRVAAIQMSSMGGAKDEQEEPSKVIELATMHGAKGKEWDCVWVTGCHEGQCPSNDAIEQEALGFHAGIEEERRLFYVAMTRARSNLMLSSLVPTPQRSVSRFIVETQLWTEESEPPAPSSDDQAKEEGMSCPD